VPPLCLATRPPLSAWLSQPNPEDYDW
jgi:hypothetical protein